MKKIHFVLLFYTVLFALVYIFTLNVNYVEGDDAETLLYHLCGRNPAIQGPYAAYNSGFDFVLRIFGSDKEAALRSLAVYISFVFGWLVMCLSAVFIDLSAKDNQGNAKYIFLYLLPFIIPDFIFHSLLVNATNVSFAFALLSLILFMQFFRKGKWAYYVLSILFLALSIPFRWSILTIFPVFFSILILYPERSVFYRIKMAVLHNAATLVLGLMLIDVSGYSLSEVYKTILWGRKYMEDSDRSILSMFATGSAFFTASFVALLLIGLFLKFFRQKKQHVFENIIFILFPIIPFFILGFLPSFKFLITALPMLLAVSFTGYAFLSKYKILNGIFIATLILSWVIGIQINATGTAAGPGFEQGFAGKISKTAISEKNVDTRIKIKKIRLAFGDGFYMPMSEGPRPLYGYLYVIFGGSWKNNIDAFTKERAKAENILKRDNRFTILQDRRTAYIECDLYNQGYHTSTSFRHDEKENLEYRDFYRTNDTIRLFVIPDTVNKIDFAKDFIATHAHVVFRSSYSSIILSILGNDSTLQAIGPYTIVKN